jgi:exosortase A-associated hydrolase 2
MLPSALPFFLKAHPGVRFCLYHEPDPQRPARGAVLYVHPFAEELNRSRRMAALQARALAAAGYGVLQIDLYGCGDSSGDFGDARLSIWRNDLVMAQQWLQARADTPLLLWGARLGALLALDHASRMARAPCALLWWQPVVNGAHHLTQFRRVHSAARILGGDAAQTAPHEIAGYHIAPALADAINALDAGSFAPPCPLHWLEAALPGEGAQTLKLAAASGELIARWHDAGATVTAYPYRGRPFWASTEISECPALLLATAELFSPAAALP